MWSIYQSQDRRHLTGEWCHNNATSIFHTLDMDPNVQNSWVKILLSTNKCTRFWSVFDLGRLAPPGGPQHAMGTSICAIRLLFTHMQITLVKIKTPKLELCPFIRIETTIRKQYFRLVTAILKTQSSVDC